jgi:diguanylate cyclase (GGDEF)-like protein
MPFPMAGALFLMLLVGSLVGLFLARLRLERERRRADAAESRSRSYFSVIETLARSLKDGSEVRGDRERLLEEARKQGLSEEDLKTLGEGMSGEGQGPAGPTVSDSRYLFVSFDEEIRRASRRGEALTILTLEAGPPSAASQVPGPVAEDRILRSVAQAVRRQMRGCDTCIRYGAREFILILPGVPPEEARQVEKRIRTAVQGISVEPLPGVVLTVRAALGSATFPRDGSGFDALLTVADVRRSRDAASDLSGGPGGSSPVPLPWLPRPISSN